jgi:hypothetical protein
VLQELPVVARQSVARRVGPFHDPIAKAPAVRLAAAHQTHTRSADEPPVWAELALLPGAAESPAGASVGLTVLDLPDPLPVSWPFLVGAGQAALRGRSSAAQWGSAPMRDAAGPLGTPGAG